jgi:hypothetical protein
MMDTIDIHNFIVYECTLNNTDRTYAINQKIYDPYINGFDFIASLFYINDIDKATLIKIMDSLKF